MGERSQYWFVRHPDDEWFDGVIVAGAGLRLVIRERYKTSGLSGDEWRFGYMWQRIVDGTWVDYDGQYSGLSTALAAFYPGLYTDHREMHNDVVGHVDFMRKDHVAYRATYEDEPRELIVVAGHLPWAELVARDAGCSPDYLHLHDLCFQPGCVKPAVSTYLLNAKWCARCGNKGEDNPTMGFGKSPRRYARRFCQSHLRRGDAGLDDADSNYEVVQGPGPGEGEPVGDKIKPAVFGGVIQSESFDG